MTVALLERATAALGPLVRDVVFVGGATLGVWITDPAAPDPRPTLDVDVVLEVASRGRLAAFEEKLRDRGFLEDQDSGVICRWLRRDPALVLDVMPSDPRVLGFASPWYPMVVQAPRPHRLPSGTTIAVVEPALFLATKLEAFRGRGGGDYFGSRDFGDVISLVDGRREVIEDVRAAPEAVRAFVASELRAHLDASRFVDGVYGALRGDPASQERAQAVVLPRIAEIVAAAERPE
jgi:hypothetical protein